MAAEVPQTLEYKGGQLNVAPVLEVENFTNWKKRFMCHIIGIEPQFKNIIENGHFIPMTAGQRKPEGQWTPDERKAANLDQRLKSLIMAILLDDQMNSVINCLTAKSTWDDLILYHKGPSDVKESRDFQDSPDDEEDTRSSQEYLNDLEEEYQARTLLAKSKRFFKKGTQRFSSAKATDQTECHKCGKKGHFARDCWSKTLVPSYQSPFQQKLLSSSQHKPELRPTKDFKAKYNKIKAKLALLNPKEVSSDENEMVEVKVLMALAEDNDAVSKESARNGEWVNISIRKHVNNEILKENKNLRIKLKELNSSNKVNQFCEKSLANDTKVSTPGVEKPWLSKAEGFILSNHDTGRILPAESQRNTTDPSVAVTDSSATDYDSMDESLVCGTPLPPLEKLGGPRSYALSWKPCQGDSLNLPDHRIHKDGDGDASFQLKSDSLPHAHAQTTKTYYKHQDSRIMKAQELKTKTSAQTLIYKIFLQRYQVYQGRLLASFQDDAKYEHVGQDTRSQGGKDDQDGRIKI
ncbi:retrovirus-related pol polyprotein from transposon TNT 1-94 [Tanacetum coccineum]